MNYRKDQLLRGEFQFTPKSCGFCLRYDALCAICLFSLSISSRRFSGLLGQEVCALS
jgi:hypothetical protein